MSPQYPLDVKGTVRATGIKVVSVDSFPDFVFRDNYLLPKLSEVKSYIRENGHLPDIPSASEVKEKGVDIVDIQAKLLQKVEELTLYVIKQQSLIEQQAQTVNAQQKQIETLERILREK